MIWVVALVVKGWWWVQFRFSGWSPSERQSRVQRWARSLLIALGLQLARPEPPEGLKGPLLLSANHISWVDILVLLAVSPCRFVAKAELHRWPFLGVMAQAGGTLFVERQSSRDAMRVMHRMVQALNDGDVVAIFPEGTTSDGSQVLRFHANLFQAAITAQAPVQPVALAYQDPLGHSCNPLVAYVGDDSLFKSLWAIVTHAGVQAVVAWAPAQPFANQTRRDWASSVEACVRKAHLDLNS